MKGSQSDTDDVESHQSGWQPLYNHSVGIFSWSGITVRVRDRKTKTLKCLIQDVSGYVKAGEVLALMGPSGSGKTTLLNHLAHRDSNISSEEGAVLVDGSTPSVATLRRLSSYVEQEDALIGSLTVKETVHFSARLSLRGHVSKRERLRRVENLLKAFGLTEQADALIGTPLRKGISGGQKRRTSVAAQIITDPKILFLDEPTSGLDSTASYEMISYLKTVAQQFNLLVIASIHQPSASTFALFDKLLLLSQGQTCYFGPTEGVQSHFSALGYPAPPFTSVPEHLLDLINTDFSTDRNEVEQRLNNIHAEWARQPHPDPPKPAIQSSKPEADPTPPDHHHHGRPNLFSTTHTLFHRMFLKSYRDVIAYGIRLAMYIGLAIMMGTVWLRLTPDQASIQPFINALFFGSAFMSFMAVAYVPAYIEDHAVFTKDRRNGLYTATPFLLANFLVGIPYLFLMSLLFSAVAYWLPNFRPSASGFFTSILWLFLDLLAAESLVVLVSSVFPVFVLALAIVAFANGLWMSVGGFLVTPRILNVFWRDVFHYVDYQAYVFQGLMVNEFGSRTYACAVGDGGEVCQCMYQTPLAEQCLIDGKGVLDSFGYPTGDTGLWVGILCGIIVGYRLLGWVAVHFLHR